MRRLSLALAAALLAGCAREVPAPGRRAVMTAEERAASAPDAQSRTMKLWYAERAPAAGAYVVELDGAVGLERLSSRLRILVVCGRMKIRVGGQERELAAGGFAAIPARVPHRVLKDGAPRLVYLALVSPDPPERTALERPGLLRRIEAAR